MNHLAKVVRAGVGRRRVQSLVMLLTVMMSVTASLLGGGLLVSARATFDEGFTKQHGAHLTARFDSTKVDSAQLAGTAHVLGVTASAGPYPIASLSSEIGENSSRLPVGLSNPPLDFVGRSDPGGAVDALTVTSGHWATGPGQVVLSDSNSPLGVGDKLRFPALPGTPVLTVVGLARSAGRSADAWVSPEQLAALTPPGTATGSQMLYRFAQAGDFAQLNADRTALAAAVPSGSMIGAASYLKIKMASDKKTATFVPFVIAFAVIGLVMSVLIIGIVVSGTVGAATRRIGILKAVGYTPAQVVRAYVGQALIPAGAGITLGILLGNLASLPVLAKAGEAFNNGSGHLIEPWLDFVVAFGALVAVAGTALVPALRAGRLRTVEALSVGRTPSAGRGRTARQLLGRLPLPRPVSLGLATPFAKPGRSATMVAAVVLGTIGVTFGLGLTISLSRITTGMYRVHPGTVEAVPLPSFGPHAISNPPQAAELSTVDAKIASYPGTKRYFSTDRAALSVVGLAGPTTVIRYNGDASWGDYQMVTGTWFHHAGEAVVPSAFLQATNTKVGDTITLANGSGRTALVRIVGEAFDLEESGMVIRTEGDSLAALDAPVDPLSIDYEIELKPGARAQDAMDWLDPALKPYGFGPGDFHPLFNPTILSMDALAVMLTGMLVAVAGLGVLNTVVLDTRERVHDLGVFKALGMSPKQTIAMVLASVSGIGLLAGLIGTPLGVALHHAVLPAMGRAGGTRLPAADLAAYHPTTLLLLILGGLVIATLGALLPATWAARTRTATALRTE